MQMADEADRKIKTGDFGPLCGIPLAIKDVLCMEGVRTTCASRILENFIPPYDATVVSKLKQANAVFVGKGNMDEFAMGSSTENSAFGATHNPWDLDRVAGGSSGGSAAAVAADECIAALGTDTGGSIRLPASYCGVVGMKPTYGRVSRYGLVAYGSSLDQIGPIAKCVEDAALLLNVICGYDPQDSTSIDTPVPDYRESLKQDIKGLKVGLPKEYFIEGIDPEVESAIKSAIDTLRSLGAEVLEVSLPATKYAVAAYYIVAPAEASSNLARYDGVKYGYRNRDGNTLMDMYKQTRTEGFGPEVLRRIMLGTYALSAGYYDAYYKKASQIRTLMKNEFPGGLRKSGCSRHSRVSHAGLQNRREDERSPANVPHRCFHHFHQYGGDSRFECALRVQRGRAAHRLADSGRTLPGGENIAGSPTNSNRRLESPRRSLPCRLLHAA